MSDKIRRITGWLILITAVIWIIWDIYAYVKAVEGTISVVITDFAFYSPMLPFAFGVLIGHWFWPAEGSGD